ncbi:MAG: ATP-binding cassette domain-containing protein [Pseudomonadota bacterium]
MALIEVDNLAVESGGRRILEGIDLTIESGTVHALVGANGSGKTSLARLLMGAEGYHAVAGTVRFEGADLLTLPMHERARRGIAIAWQEPVVIEGLTVADYLGCGPVRQPAAACLEQVGLDAADYLPRPLDARLSGGERRRIELAAVLSLAPKLAILDEPTAGIDLSSLPLIEAAIPALRQGGAAVLLITHEEALARQADVASQICAGRIVCSGDPERVVERYKRRLCDRCDGGSCHG